MIFLQFLPALLSLLFKPKIKEDPMIAITPFAGHHWPAVQTIYQQGIDTQNATFQEQAKSWPEWDAGMLKVCRLVAVDGATVAGWAALSAVSSRAVYAGVAEVSIYIAPDYRGQRVGRHMLAALIAASEQAGFWTLQAGVFPENAGSVALLKSCGFRVVGMREKLGQMKGRWRDVLLLERRSQVVGT
jgi:phosphinothricin acetyltransferase